MNPIVWVRIHNFFADDWKICLFIIAVVVSFCSWSLSCLRANSSKVNLTLDIIFWFSIILACVIIVGLIP